MNKEMRVGVAVLLTEASEIRDDLWLHKITPLEALVLNIVLDQQEGGAERLTQIEALVVARPYSQDYQIELCADELVYKGFLFGPGGDEGYKLTSKGRRAAVCAAAALNEAHRILS